MSQPDGEKDEDSGTIPGDGYETSPRQIRNTETLSFDPNAAWQKIRANQFFRDLPIVGAKDSKWRTDDSDCTRFVCMSDTHGKHREISAPKGDVLLHGGDFTSTGEIEAIQDLCTYFKELAFPTTICIAGNHDLTIHTSYYKSNWNRFHRSPKNSADGRRCFLDLMKASHEEKTNKFCYLEDDSCTITGTQRTKCGPKPIDLHCYGSPWSPEFYNWAFNVPRGQPSWELWSRIPDATDILITHGPPLGRGDLCAHGGRAGCYDLLDHVQQRVQPRLHVFGHIHEAYGTSYDGRTLYVNASNMNLNYEAVHPCVVIDLPHDPSQPARIVQPACSMSSDAFLTWCHDKGYSLLANGFSQLNEPQKAQLPSGNALLDTADAYEQICEMLSVVPGSNVAEMKCELRKALSQIYAESF